MKHGLYNTRFYRIWHCMLTRCNNKNAVQYPRYGAKGIRVEWPSFAEFKNDMYKSYLLHIEKYGETQTSIDRIKNTGNYSKTNCKWATLREQGKNKTNNILIAYNGKTQCLSEWAKEFNLPYFTLLKRYRKNWPIEKLFRASEQLKTRSPVFKPTAQARR